MTGRDQTAKRVSQATQPLISTPVGVFALGAAAGGPRWGVIMLAFSAGAPVALLLLLNATGWLDSHRERRRPRRIVLLTMCVLVELAAAPLYKAWGAPSSLPAAQVVLAAGLACVALLTVWTRVSAHTAFLGILTMPLIAVGGPVFLPTLALVPIAAWSRLRLHAHTLPQVMVGAVAPALVTAATSIALIHNQL